MEKLRIIGGESLQGEIDCSGSKNAALPIIAASIMSDKKISLESLFALIKPKRNEYKVNLTTIIKLIKNLILDQFLL